MLRFKTLFWSSLWFVVVISVVVIFSPATDDPSYETYMRVADQGIVVGFITAIIWFVSLILYKPYHYLKSLAAGKVSNKAHSSKRITPDVSSSAKAPMKQDINAITCKSCEKHMGENDVGIAKSYGGNCGDCVSKGRLNTSHDPQPNLSIVDELTEPEKPEALEDSLAQSIQPSEQGQPDCPTNIAVEDMGIAQEHYGDTELGDEEEVGSHFYNAIVYKGADYPTQNPQILAHGRKRFTTEEIYKSLNFASESMQHRISLNFASVIMDNHLLDLKERSYVQGNHYEQNITAFMEMVLRDITANEQNHKFYHVLYMDNVWPLANFICDYFEEIKDLELSADEFIRFNGPTYEEDQNYSYLNVNWYEEQMRKHLDQ